MPDDAWLFAYGSLIFRPDSAFEERRRAVLDGSSRRFFQGSTDHRGVPGAPGRVVTLVPGGRCVGVAYRVAAGDRARVLGYLDVREQGGYGRALVDVRTDSGVLRATTYIAGPDNPDWAGEAEVHELARVIALSAGPSGSNREYALALAEALRELDAGDEHVEAVAQSLLTRST